MFVSPGWPGAHHSVDICEGLEEWPGGRDPFHPSDTEDEVLVQLVRLNADTFIDRAVVEFRQEEQHNGTSQFLSNLPTDELTFGGKLLQSGKWKVTAEPLTSDVVRNREKVRRRQTKAIPRVYINNSLGLSAPDLDTRHIRDLLLWGQRGALDFYPPTRRINYFYIYLFYCLIISVNVENITALCFDPVITLLDRGPYQCSKDLVAEFRRLTKDWFKLESHFIRIYLFFSYI